MSQSMETPQPDPLFRHIIQGVVRCDSTGAVVDANPAAEQIIGLQLSQMRSGFLGDAPWQYVREDGSLVPLKDYPHHQALRTGKPIPSVVLGIDHASRGERRWLLVSAVPEPASAGAVPNNIFTIFHDITDQKRTLESLRAREANYRILVESGPNLAWVTDANGVMEYVNKRWIEYTGRDLETTRALGWHDLAPLDESGDSLTSWKEGEAAGQPHEAECQLRRFDGEYRWFLARGIPLRSDTGDIVGWFGTCTDIHDQKRAEQTQGFLSDLGEAMRRDADPNTILWMAVQALGEFLHANRCLYAEIDGDQGEITVHRDYCHGVASIAGTYSTATFGIARDLLLGQTVAISDTRADPRTADQYTDTYEPFDIRSGIAVPIISNGQQIALLSVQQAGEPRTWLPDEISLVETVADRTSLALENSRLQRALQVSATRERQILRDVLASVTEGRLILCTAPDQLPPAPSRASGTILLTQSEGLRTLRMAAEAASSAVGLPEDRMHDLITAVGEAGLNAIVHVGEGVAEVFADKDGGIVQVRISDEGHGISLENLPSATLRKGYTTAGTLGHGMKMMLQTADAVYLLTGGDGTTVVVEKGRVGPDETWGIWDGKHESSFSQSYSTAG